MHPLFGRKQTPEQIRKRTAAMLATRAKWTPEERESARLNASCAQLGHVPWNKGNNWRDKFTPEEIRKISALRARNRRTNNPNRRIHDRLSTLVRLSLKHGKNGRAWEGLVGYTQQTLIRHLRKSIPNGYTWQDYIEGHLELDHLIPRSAFKFETTEDIDFRRCWALGNLQLLPAFENNHKKDNITQPFQPSLRLTVSKKTK